MKSGLVTNLLAFVLITALTGFVSFLLEKAGLGTSNAVVLWVVSVTILLFLFFLYRQKLWIFCLDRIARVSLNRFGKKIGLTQVYENFNEAKEDLRKAFEEAQEARILIQLGHGIIGGNKSLLFDSAQKKKGRGFQMRLLYADKESPQLSQNRAKVRGSNFKEWQAAITSTEGNIEALLDDDIHIEARRHSEPYLWRLFFFDRTLFFVPYLAERDNSAQAPAFKFVANDNNKLAIYYAFSEYFEHIWKKEEGNSFRPKQSVPAR